MCLQVMVKPQIRLPPAPATAALLHPQQQSRNEPFKLLQAHGKGKGPTTAVGHTEVQKSQTLSDQHAVAPQSGAKLLFKRIKKAR